MSSLTPYSRTARIFHWTTVAAVAVMVGVGLTMTYRGGVLNIWDATTNALYSSHKLLGFLLLWFVLARLSFRLMFGAPPPEPTLEAWQRIGSSAVHWLLYALLIAMPVLGWIGVSLYPALDIFGLFSLPALMEPNEAAAERVLGIHKALAFLLIALAAGHARPSPFHHFFRKDNVLRRLWPGRDARLGLCSWRQRQPGLAAAESHGHS